ncbi:putative dithiol-disulfide oxidoreductase (DUF899 family) [Pseudonocardia hierapolitana]|uniref:Putative dithiol-disulfide oxidoreductase (DUF899 family) n=1 Tax=Pseudonocardia hierapolitana TaxID=1128676 RepID=A0A561T3A6_9PSEU|nr:DUF899 domain-containing protein [Pseudonocardia hierapolitana]TWF81590.1 putative dithiol-disulfide oxidoreductase (DUF899 family) [Pseudonocardia hierapolitana]
MSAPTRTELPPEALPPIVTPDEWAESAAELRAAEKAHMRAGDELAARRRRMPMVEFGSYTFQGAAGPATLLDLFEGRRQLVVYQFMAGPPWCEGCCMFTDQIGELAHLHARDTTMANVSLSRYEDLAALRERMGWQVPFYSSSGNDFAADCGTAEGFGLSVFLRHGDRVFRTYFTADRGVEAVGSVWSILDRTPLGRQETWEDTPAGRPQTAAYEWWRLHDEY